MTDEDWAWFRERLGDLDRWKSFHWLLCPEEDIADELKAVTVESLKKTEEFSKAADKIAFICSKLAVTHEQVAAVEKATRGQNKNPK